MEAAPPLWIPYICTERRNEDQYWYGQPAVYFICVRTATLISLTAQLVVVVVAIYNQFTWEFFF